MLKIKDGLEFYPIGGDLVHVYDVSTSRHFKLGQQEVAWLRLLDGTRSTEQLAARIPYEYFQRFLATVARMGLLQPPAGEAPQRARRSLLKIKVLNVDPRRLLDARAGLARGYRDALAWITAPVFLLNVALIAALFPTAQATLQALPFGWSVIPFYLAAMLLIGLVHEVSHALVARSYGVTVPRIGFMLFFFHPAFYADVSAINMLPNRAERVRTLIAGIQANNLLALLGLGVAVATMGTGIFAYALMFVAINFVLIFVNLIPFVEYDGYYLFQELVGEPNFNRNALVHVLGAPAGTRRPEYLLFFGLSQAFQVSLVVSVLILLRTGVQQFWSGIAVDLTFLALILVSVPALSMLRLRAMR